MKPFRTISNGSSSSSVGIAADSRQQRPAAIVGKSRNYNFDKGREVASRDVSFLNNIRRCVRAWAQGSATWYRKGRLTVVVARRHDWNPRQRHQVDAGSAVTLGLDARGNVEEEAKKGVEMMRTPECQATTQIADSQLGNREVESARH
uniref:Uncharacterized protein n=1 Tax=Trichuris muris TaxID=70415 RepID=A0A5S6QZ43_TRIMR